MHAIVLRRRCKSEAWTACNSRLLASKKVLFMHTLASNILRLLAHGGLFEMFTATTHWGEARVEFSKCIVQLFRENESCVEIFTERCK